MSQKLFLSPCLALLAAATVATGQPAVAPPSQTTVPPVEAAPPGMAPILEIGQPDPLVLFPTVPPGESYPANSISADGPIGGINGDSLWTRPTLTGDWFGLRPRLQESGVTFDGNITQWAFGLGGGINTPRVPPPLGQGDVFAYTGRGDYNLTFDLEKFGGLPKGKLNVGFQNWWGQFGNVSLNSGAFTQPVIGAFLPPVPNDPGVPFLTDFYLTQPLSKNWVVFGGKKTVIGSFDQDDFAGGRGTANFSNMSLNANPAFLLAMPYTGFTAGVVNIQEWGTVTGFVYDPKNRIKNFFALDSLFSEGIIMGGEVKVNTKFFGLPGEQYVGGLWKHVELTNLAFDEPTPGVYPYQAVGGSPTLNDSYTIYYGFDQYWQVYSEDPKRGWGVFGRASISDGNPTPVRYFLSTGIGGYSPFRYRQGDTFGIGWYYVGFSDQFGPRPRAVFGPQDGTGVEIFYNYQVTPWLTFTPDFQILKPESGAIANTSYIGGIRLNVKF